MRSPDQTNLLVVRPQVEPLPRDEALDDSHFKVHIALFLFIAAMLAMAARLVQLEVEEKTFYKIKEMRERFACRRSMPIGV